MEWSKRDRENREEEWKQEEEGGEKKRGRKRKGSRGKGGGEEKFIPAVKTQIHSSIKKELSGGK